MKIGTIQQIWRYPVKSLGGEQVNSTYIEPKGVANDRCWSVRDNLTGELVGGRKIPGLMMLMARFVTPVQAKFGKPVEAVVEIEFPDGQTIRSDDAYCDAMLSMFLSRQVSLISRPVPKDKKAYRLARPMTPAEVRYALGMKPNDPDPDFSSFSLGMLTTLSRYATPPGVLYDVYPLHLMTTAALDYIGQHYPEGEFSVRRYRPNFLIETDPQFQGIVENDWSGRILHIGDLRIQCNHPTIRCSMPGAAQPGLPKDPNIPLTLMKHAGQHLGAYATPIEAAEIRVGDVVELMPDKRGKLSLYFDQLGKATKAKVLQANNVMGDLLDRPQKAKPNTELPAGFNSYTVTRREMESEDVVSLTLKRLDGQAVTRFVPGQHLVVAIPQSDGRLTYRPYSISSGSHELDQYRLSVKLKEDGVGSGYLHKQVQVGDTLSAKSPSGQFATKPSTQLPLVLISSGIGITPFMSILHTLATENKHRVVHLIHGIRSTTNHPFKDELDSLKTSLPNLTVQLWVSQTDKESADRELFEGRINVPEALNRIYKASNCQYMVCGTPEFSLDMRDSLLKLNVEASRIMTESFGASRIKGPNDGKSYEIKFIRSGHTATWDASKESLLDLAESLGIQASSGCRYGACQACEARLITGEVSYPDGVQPPAGKNNLLLCSARPTSNLEIAL